MKRFVAVVIASIVTLAACGSDESSSSPDNTSGSSTETLATDAPDTTDAPPKAESSTTDSSTTDPDVEEAGAAFPVSIEHKFGSTTIEVEPERVVSVGFNEHDFLLAIGVTPVGLRDWYGEQPNGVWPWAQDELGEATPEVIAADALNFEQIAALDPDLIVGVWSGMTAEDYELLAAIAPTVAQPDTYDDYGTPWQEQTMILGTATGRTMQAQAEVERIDALFAAARDANPQWEGQFASVAFVTADGPGAYTSQDTRSRIMADLGFSIPEVNDSGGDDSFFLSLSAEDLTPLDVDVLMWIYTSDEELDGILTQLPTRPALDAVALGREVFAGPELTGAFSHGSPLSLEFALEQLIPEIQAAADGDPATVVASAAEVGAVDGAADDVADAEASPVGGDESSAASDAWSTVFDSTVPFDDKAAFLADAGSLAATVEAYTAAGNGFGGISLVPSDVVVEGDTAEITYDVNFGENPAYSNQTGTLQLVDGVWTVSRDEFCSFMTSARVMCS
ncbi:MAG: ABC transporter substrate-binding protein [Ilumatobacter sp.]